jgi:hypothetical protein
MGVTVMTNAPVVNPKKVMEKDAFIVALPLLASLAYGALSAHGLYRGAKNIAKGNYGAGAFDIATSLPWIGTIGKGLKGAGMLARIISRGGKVGNLGKRFASVGGTAAKATRFRQLTAKALKKGYKLPEAQNFAARMVKRMPAQEAARAASKAGKSWEITNKVRDVSGRAAGAIGRGYRGLGWMPKSAPSSTLPKMYQPVSWGARETARGLSSLGRRVENVGSAIEATRFGKQMSGPLGFGLMMAGPEMIGLDTGQRPQQPVDQNHLFVGDNPMPQAHIPGLEYVPNNVYPSGFSR